MTTYNPRTWAYKKMITGQMSPDTRRIMYIYDQKMKEYHETQILDCIYEMLIRHNEIAVSYSLLTRRIVEKHRKNRVKIGRKTFYIFSADCVPADVAGKVRIEKDTRVYV